MNEKRTLFDIFLTFLKIGAILLGGGYVIFPVLQSEIVEKRNWITEEELLDYYAISQSLPGLIAINVSIFVGYKIRGKLGAIVAVCGLTFSAFFSIVLISLALNQIATNKIIKGAFWGVDIAVLILIFSAVKEMWDKTITDIASVIIYVAVLSVMLITKISPVYIVIASIFIGIIYKIIKKNRGDEC